MSQTPPSGPHRIVFANEKGGTGKSTTAVHVAVALAYQGARVAALDLDPRQRTMFRYLENRGETERRRGIQLPGARFGVFTGETVEELDRAGRLIGYIGMVTDVTELQDTREELQRARGELEQRVKERTQQVRDMAMAVEQSDDGIIRTDKPGSIVGWNRAAERLFGYTAAEAIGMPVLTLVPPEELKTATKAPAQRIARNAPASIKATKELIHAAASTPFVEQLEAEARGIAGCMQTEPYRIAVAKFLGK